MYFQGVKFDTTNLPVNEKNANYMIVSEIENELTVLFGGGGGGGGVCVCVCVCVLGVGALFEFFI